MDTLNTTVDLERIKTMRAVSIVLIGLTSGMLSGVLGIGGGVVLVPAMVLLLGLSQHRAHGTSLAYMSPVAFMTAISYARHGSVDWLVAIELAIGGVIGAAIGARLCARLSANKLKVYFGIFLVFIGLRMLFDVREAFAAMHGPIVFGSTLAADQPLGAVVVLGIGLVTGILSGLLGIGGGIVMIPTLVLLFGYSQPLAQGISLAVIIPVSISGMLIHNRHGNVRWGIAGWLVVGGIVGGLLGARLANVDLSEQTLRALFGCLMLITGSLMVRRAKTSASN